jgi:hypothetical protein
VGSITRRGRRSRRKILDQRSLPKEIGLRVPSRMGNKSTFSIPAILTPILETTQETSKDLLVPSIKETLVPLSSRIGSLVMLA